MKNPSIRATDIHSLTDFTRNAKRYVGIVKETRNPIAITVNGKAEVVVQDAASYQQMVDELEHARFLGAILEGERAVQEGQTLELDEAFDEIFTQLKLPR